MKADHVELNFKLFAKDFATKIVSFWAFFPDAFSRTTYTMI